MNTPRACRSTSSVHQSGTVHEQQPQHSTIKRHWNHTHTPAKTPSQNTSKHSAGARVARGGGQKVQCLRFKSACLDDVSGIDGLPGMLSAAPGTLTRQTQLFSTGNLVRGCASISVCVSLHWCVGEAGTFSSCCAPYLPNRCNHRPATA